MSIKAGVARRDITPPLGSVMPGGWQERKATGIHDPLHVTALVLDEGRTQVAFVSVDCLSLKASTVRQARENAFRFCGIPPSHILIAATHTHCGGPTADVLGSKADPNYCRFVAEQIGLAIGEAFKGRRPAQIGVGVGEEGRIAFNRRFIMKDGRHETHPGKGNPNIVAPAGPVDPQVGVLAVQDKTGAFLCCLVNYACHCTVMTGTEFSADYPFFLSETIRKVLGETCYLLFLPGACGDVTQVSGTALREWEFGERWAWKIGTVLGSEVLKTIALMDFVREVKLRVETGLVRLFKRSVPPELLREAKRLLAKDDKGSRDHIFAREVLLVDEEVRKEPFVDAEVQAILVGDTAFGAVPGELFCRFGLDIKRASPFPATFVVTCANGMVGYLPTPDAFKGGGYEVRLARSSKLTPDAGGKVVTAVVDLLHRLHRRFSSA